MSSETVPQNFISSAIAANSTALPELIHVPVEPVDARSMMLDIGRCWELLVDVREKPGYERGYRDGFPVASAIKRDPNLTYNDIGALWLEARATGKDPVEFFNEHFDMSGTEVLVRDASPGEELQNYMDYMTDVALRRPMPRDHGIYLGLRHPADAPGTRFIGNFPGDNGVVALGKLARGNVEGALQTIENDIDLIDRFGFPPNWNGLPSLDRDQEQTISFSIEGLATAYGDRGQEVIDHFRASLSRYVDWQMRGRDVLEAMQHNEGGAELRLVMLPGEERDLVFRFYSDAIVDYDTKQGLRLESLYEDYEMAERVLGDLVGEARAQRFLYFMRNVLTACATRKDFQPGTQSADYKTVEQLRITEIAPVSLQAKMVHLLRMAGRTEEANKLAEVISRRFWDPKRRQYGDLLLDGTHTAGLDATMVYPLLLGGTPYEHAIGTADMVRRELLREYGVTISNANTNQQWDGSPGTEEEPGENRGWPSENMWMVEAFTMAAIDARMQGNDPEPLLQLAEEIQAGFCAAVEAWYAEYGNIPEKLCMIDPTKFVNGGEYAKVLKDVQKGFGMTIGAYRVLKARNLRAEVYDPKKNSWRQHTLKHIGEVALAA